MIFATNGRAQDLPQGTQFVFWTQEDYRRAYLVGLMEADSLYGEFETVAYEPVIASILQALSQDSCKAFVSRPQGQSIDWMQVGRFWKWVFSSKDPFVWTELERDIRFNTCASWFPKFLGESSQLVPGSAACIATDAAIDKVRFCRGVSWMPCNALGYCFAGNQINPSIGKAFFGGSDSISGVESPKEASGRPAVLALSEDGDVEIVGQEATDAGDEASDASKGSGIWPYVAIGGLISLGLGALAFALHRSP